MIFFFLLQTVGVTKNQNHTLPVLTTERSGFPWTLKTPEFGGTPWPLMRLEESGLAKKTVWRIPVDAMLCVLDISRQHLWSLPEMLHSNSISRIYENYKMLQWARESALLATRLPGKHEAFCLIGDRVFCLLPAWELWRTLVGSASHLTAGALGLQRHQPDYQVYMGSGDQTSAPPSYTTTLHPLSHFPGPESFSSNKIVV